MKNNTSGPKDNSMIVTPKPVLVVPDHISSGLKVILVNNLMSIAQFDPLGAEVAAAGIRLTWPGFKSA